ncbi:sensor histidine kinase [Serpentinicella alkaliphila]|uniref:sensor histidine kinase n=1 Tax=Serpentinicella alkaliphila TaxID=1734049 RepID=UPI001A9B9433|nr:ATP-binding protein [Serpentinicella alkaliphila]QUH25025.1 GHKL domain-containing protein [Serpentinicella alkaliphila]
MGLINNIILSIKDYSKAHNLNVEFFSNVDECIIACDPEKIERIMLNLLSNAIKFTESGGHIKVDIHKSEDEIKISVNDSGIGIPEDKLMYIFNRFSQVDKGLHRNREGSGIGLSLVKSFVDMHEGKINVSSKLGEGTEFTIVLPVREIEDRSGNEQPIDISQSNVEIMQIEFADIYRTSILKLNKFLGG